MKTKADVNARAYLKNIAAQFVPCFGEMVVTNEEIVFNSPPMELKRVVIKTKKSKFFIGGLFSIQIVGEYEKQSGMVKDKHPIIIGYKGMMIKGSAYFKHEGTANAQFLEKLNQHEKLIQALSSLDLEKGEIRMGEEKLEVSLTPLGGSYMYLTVPPMNYTGSLQKVDIESICRTMLLIGDVIREQTEKVISEADFFENEVLFV